MKSEIATAFIRNFPTLADRVKAYITVNRAEAQAEAAENKSSDGASGESSRP